MKKIFHSALCHLFHFAIFLLDSNPKKNFLIQRTSKVSLLNVSKYILFFRAHFWRSGKIKTFKFSCVFSASNSDIWNWNSQNFQIEFFSNKVLLDSVLVPNHGYQFKKKKIWIKNSKNSRPRYSNINSEYSKNSTFEFQIFSIKSTKSIHHELSENFPPPSKTQLNIN